MWRGLKWCFWNESVCFQSAFGPLNSSCLSDAGQGIDDIFPFLSKWTNHTYGFLPLPLAVPVQRLWNAFEACNYSGEPAEARNGTAKGRECLLAAIRCPARCWPLWAAVMGPAQSPHWLAGAWVCWAAKKLPQLLDGAEHDFQACLMQHQLMKFMLIQLCL